MSGSCYGRVIAAALFSYIPVLAPSAHADEQLPDLVITATRTELDPARSGSAITVISAKDIERSGAASFASILKTVPGLDIYESGGLGSLTSVSLRGAQDGQTLVMIDGIRVGDPSSTAGETDLGTLSVTDVERIEVLRGPQSALYGSNAMGGVINIITKRGKRDTKREVSIEAGSYGTLHTRASISGGDEKVTYSLGIDALHSEGFPHFGYRIDRPMILGQDFGAGFPLPALPSRDPVSKGGVNGHISYMISADMRFDFGVNANGDWLRLDNPYVADPSHVFDPYNRSAATTAQAYGRLTADMFDGKLRNQLTLFGNIIDRSITEREICYDPATFLSFDCRLGYRGTRVGGDYQGDLKLGSLGLFTFGVHNETETAQTSQSPDIPGTFTASNVAQVTNAVFAQHQITLFDRLDLSAGGRIDAIVNGQTFATWRATAAYRLTETGTKLRASAGTGARAASLFQRYSSFGSPNLLPEQNFGYDAGLDQSLFGGKLTLSATAFHTDYRNLIDYRSGCSIGCYYNVNQAVSSGVEFSADADVVPDTWRARAGYTDLGAQQINPTTALLHRPRNKGNISLIYSGIPRLELEGRMTYVGARNDIDFYTSPWPYPTVTLAAYTKVDALASYKLDSHVTVFARIENLTDARYEEVFNYGVAGRSVYGGVRVAW